MKRRARRLTRCDRYHSAVYEDRLDEAAFGNADTVPWPAISEAVEEDIIAIDPDALSLD